MGSDRDPDPDLVPLLVRRGELLARVVADPTAKSRLAETLDLSRSTVDRAVRELETAGLVEDRDGAVRATVRGRLLVVRYDRFAERAAAVREADQILDQLSNDLLSPDLLAVLEDATVYPPGSDPAGSFERLETALEHADDLRAVVGPATRRYCLDSIRERVIEGGMTAELVCDPAFLEGAVTAGREALVSLLDEGGCTLLRSVDTSAYELLLVDEEVWLVAGDEPPGLIAADSDAAIEWGETIYRRRRTDAVPLSP